MAARVGHHGEEEEHDHDDFDSFVVTAVGGCQSSMRCARASAMRSVLPACCASRAMPAVAGKAAPVVVQAVGGRVELAFARPDVNQAERLVVIGLKGFDRDAVRRALAG